VAKRWITIAIVAVAGIAAARPAIAGHPMLTEDTGTQGTGNFELELGYSWARDGGDRFFVFQPQLSYGLTPSLDLIAQPSWLSNDTTADSRVHGLGDTALDVKWRFFGSDPFSLAVRAGATLATSENDLGLPSGTVATHATLVATLDVAPFTIDANLGYARNPDAAGLRRSLYHASAAALYACTERLSFVIDMDADSNADTSRSMWPAVALLGAIYTLRPGLDIDAGYRKSLNSAAAATQWLLGITYRWAP